MWWIFRIFGLEKIAVLSMHGTPDIDGRHHLAFKSHNSASMGKLRIPCYEIMHAFMAGDGHGAKNRLKVQVIGFSECGRWNVENMPARYSVHPFHIPHSQFRIQILVPVALDVPQAHILQHPPGAFTILLIVGIAGFNDGLNHLIADPTIF